MKAFWTKTLAGIHLWAISALSFPQVTFDVPTVQPEWNHKPNADSTGHLVFQSMSSLLQRWPNNRYINGHTIAPATIAPGTLLYHGRESSEIPTTPEWLATDPEHSLRFCTQQDFFFLTFVATRELRLVYFDGSAAAKVNSGTMDTQDLLVYGKFDPGKRRREKDRILDLCAWGKPFGIDGFVRMEMDFEIMLCDFSEVVRLVSNPALVPVKLPPPPPKFPYWNETFPPPGWKGSLLSDAAGRFEVIQAGSWHNHAPGETRVKIDYTGAVSLYQPSITSLVAARRNQTRDEYRVANISREDAHRVRAEVLDVFSRSAKGSGMDWKSIMHVVIERYGDRIELLNHLLRHPGSRNTTEQALQVRTQVLIMLTPYMLADAVTFSDSGSRDWIAPIAKQCASTFTAWVPSTITREEIVIKGAIEEVLHEICRVLSDIWLDAFEVESANIESTNAFMFKWKRDVAELMAWLDWSVWDKCNPACSFEEICYVPEWPWLPGNPWPPVEDDGMEPRCIRRVEPYAKFVYQTV